MTMPPAVLWFDHRTEGGASVSTVTLEGLAGPLGPRARFSYSALDEAGLPTAAVLDSMVAAALLPVQGVGQDLVVRGPMSRLGLYNLGQLAEARHGTSPERYPRAIAITPDSIVETVPTAEEPDAASLSFSGGLDSTYTAITLGQRGGEPGVPRLGQLVIVQGFDSRLDQPEGLARMVARVTPLARDAGVALRVVRTDVWPLGSRLWPQTATPFMVPALAMFAHRYPTGIIGGGIPYGAGRVGLGHPAVLDQFCSGAAFRMMTHGAGLPRSEKLRALLDHPEVLRHLRVCVSGFEASGDPSRNCGTCGKCLDLWMTFQMLGIADPPCFDAPVEPWRIATIHAPHVFEARDLGCVHEDALRTGASGPWVALLARRLAYVPPTTNLLRAAGLWLRERLPRPVRAAIRRRLPAELKP